jgi:hypothetical protein
MDKSILGMSDEELLELGPQNFADRPVEQEASTATEDPEQKEEQEQAPVTEESETDANKPDDDEQVEKPSEEEEEGKVKSDEPPASTDKPSEDPNKPAEAKDKPTEPEKKPAANAEAELAKLFAPFKASGREIKVESVDEAIQLMQKGLNYHDKMAALKPSLNVVRMLEREGLLDPAKLNHLIDIHKKNPEAIAKLVKDSGIDILDVDDKKVAGYKPGQHELSESESALEDAMTDLKLSPAYDRVIDFAGNRLDQASKQLIVQNPHVLLHFANQIETGVFDVIQAELSKQKVLGNLKGMNDLQAYDAVGKALNEKGAFNHLLNKQQEEKPPVVIPPKASKVVDPAVAAAKAAAAPAKAAPTGKTGKPDFNPLALSDEEFEQLAKKQY